MTETEKELKPAAETPGRGKYTNQSLLRALSIMEQFFKAAEDTLGITEQIIFPEINIDSISKLMGMNITFVTSANTDEEGFALLKQFGLPFKNK